MEFFKTVGKGIKTMVGDFRESQKPENQLKRIKEKTKVAKAKKELAKEKEQLNNLNKDNMDGLRGLVDNAQDNMNNVFGTDIFNKKNKGGLI